MAMRSILLRCLVVLVALAFVGGASVNARTQSMSLGAERLSNHDAADAGASLKNSAQHHKVHACLCCCLGCASFASRAPDCTSTRCRTPTWGSLISGPPKFTRS